MYLVEVVRASTRVLGLVDDIGSATGGVVHPDEQNQALDAGAELLSRIPDLTLKAGNVAHGGVHA